MEYRMENRSISVTVDTLGGEITSIKKNGFEYLWHGDKSFWPMQSPILFPFIGRLAEKRFIFKGKTYPMRTHGFISEKELECQLSSKDKLVLTTTSDKISLAEYPFEFVFRLTYQLRDNTIKIKHEIINKGSGKMFFALGCHPGFLVPLENGLDFTDYYLEFEGKSTLKQMLIDEKEHLLTGEEEPYNLVDEQKLFLDHKLFDIEALVFTNMSKVVTLKSDKGSRSVKLYYPNMNYLAIWHTRKSKAPFICIEPWSSLPGKVGEITDLEKKEDLILLEAEGLYKNNWWITIN